MSSIIVTGSGGILGRALIKQLSYAPNVEVIALTSQVDRLKYLYGGRKNIKVYGCISELEELPNSICINCSFPRSSQPELLANSISYTSKLIDDLTTLGCSLFVNVSSQSVYAQQGDEIQSEEDNVAPSSLYGMTKYALEHIVSLKCKENKIQGVNIRLGSLVSVDFKQRMINRFYMKITQKEEILIDDGSPKVSYLHVDDAAQALVQLVLNSDNIHYSLYNLANNDWMMIADLVYRCCDQAELLNLPTPIIVSSGIESQYNNIICSDLFYQEFNWTPKYTMLDLVNLIFTELSSENL